MAASTSTTDIVPPVLAHYGLSEGGTAFADGDLSAFATCSDPAFSLPITELFADLPEELLDRLPLTRGGSA